MMPNFKKIFLDLLISVMLYEHGLSEVCWRRRMLSIMKYGCIRVSAFL